MKFTVSYIKINPNNTKVVQTEDVDITGEFFHRLDKEAMVWKAKKRMK